MFPSYQHDLATQRFPMERLRSDAHFPIYEEHLLAALHNGNADGKHCSKACAPELRFITAEVAVPNGTALIAALCSLHISMTLQHSASQWNACDQMRICLKSGRGLVYFLGKGAEKARSKRDQSEIKHYPK